MTNQENTRLFHSRASLPREESRIFALCRAKIDSLTSTERARCHGRGQLLCAGDHVRGGPLSNQMRGDTPLEFKRRCDVVIRRLSTGALQNFLEAQFACQRVAEPIE
jgi:hypothetical protein